MNLKTIHIFMKIKEFSDVLYLNGSSVGGFCQIMRKEKGPFTIT